MIAGMEHNFFTAGEISYRFISPTIKVGKIFLAAGYSNISSSLRVKLFMESV